MTLSFVLRLDPDHLRDGQIVGQAEHVVTGQRRTVGDVSELVDFLRRAAAADVDDRVD